MNKPQICIRMARRSDAPTIARVVAMAIGDEVALRNYCGAHYLDVLTTIARTRETQYSWQNALIAECDGRPAGAVVGYDGARLATLREGTFAVLRAEIGRVPTIDDETEVGEFYLDSVAVLPPFRGLGVGAELVNAFCERAFCAGVERVGLIVDTANPKAERLYTAAGFVCVGERIFFGHPMHHLQRTNPWSVRERVVRSTRITDFQRRVYLALLDVPAGSTTTYGELARRIGCRSAQAVGQALRHNPFAPEVPCHRVIAADGSLGGYGGHRDGEQLARKKELLAAEQRVNNTLKGEECRK